MRWFKHYSDVHDQEELAQLIDSEGAEIYGIYWLILEKIVKQMDASLKAEATYSLKYWANHCRVSTQKMAKVLQKFGKTDLLLPEFCQGSAKRCKYSTERLVTISCPMLLKLSDIYTKRKRPSVDKLLK
jgi:hypothetical protein